MKKKRQKRTLRIMQNCKYLELYDVDPPLWTNITGFAIFRCSALSTLAAIEHRVKQSLDVPFFL